MTEQQGCPLCDYAEGEIVSNQPPRCELCGDPMPPGEEMFKFHGFSGGCTKPPLRTPEQKADQDCEYVKAIFKRATGVDVKVRIHNGKFMVTDPAGEEFDSGLVRKQ